MENKKEILVSAIENGTVIDHIPTESVYQVIRILGLEKYKDEVLIGNYLNSGKLGKKGIIKIKNKHFSVEEVSKIALVAPFATIIDIADYLSVPVIAEGVETEGQLNLLRNAGCNLVQGYYFSAPLPAAEFERKILSEVEKA